MDRVGRMSGLATELLRVHGEAVNRLIETLPARLAGAPPQLIESIMYSLRAGGKRMRPTLVLETFSCCQGTRRDAAEIAALTMEMIHTFSLVHDDLPAMDNDDLRRGKPTNHKVFGEAMAILAGDGMICMSAELLAAVEPAELGRMLARELMRASGPQGMIGGQVLDILAEGRQVTGAELSEIHRRKTGALITASVRLGAMAAGVSPSTLGALTTFGNHIGLAFQIVDDILDVTSTPEQLGKATQKDVSAGKNTYPAVHGLAASRAKAEGELAAGIRVLEAFGERGAGLGALARFVVERLN